MLAKPIEAQTLLFSELLLYCPYYLCVFMYLTYVIWLKIQMVDFDIHYEHNYLNYCITSVLRV